MPQTGSFARSTAVVVVQQVSGFLPQAVSSSNAKSSFLILLFILVGRVGFDTYTPMATANRHRLKGICCPPRLSCATAPNIGRSPRYCPELLSFGGEADPLIATYNLVATTGFAPVLPP